MGKKIFKKFEYLKKYYIEAIQEGYGCHLYYHPEKGVFGAHAYTGTSYPIYVDGWEPIPRGQGEILLEALEQTGASA